MKQELETLRAELHSIVDAKIDKLIKPEFESGWYKSSRHSEWLAYYEPIKEDTILTIQYYRLLTGACEFGVKEWMSSNNINEGITAKELLPILEKTNAYGLSKFKQLITF